MDYKFSLLQIKFNLTDVTSPPPLFSPAAAEIFSCFIMARRSYGEGNKTDPFITPKSSTRRTNDFSAGVQEPVKPTNRFSRYAQSPGQQLTPKNSAPVAKKQPVQTKQPAFVAKQNVSANKKSAPTSSSKALTARKTPGMLAPKGYTVRPIIPASKRELLPVARAMNREQFAPRLKKLFDPEREAALEAIESGIYVGWRCPEFKHDCIRVGKNSRCFCGHVLSEHASYHSNSVRVPCPVPGCGCKAFAFVPSRAEEVGEWWLPRRVTFDPSTWRAKCKCKHTHDEHAPNGARRCRAGACPCASFNSSFVCCACDRHWGQHETVFESGEERRQKGVPYGQHYLPFHELPELRNVVLTGHEDDNSFYEELAHGPYAIPENKPTALSLRLQQNSEKPW